MFDAKFICNKCELVKSVRLRDLKDLVRNDDKTLKCENPDCAGSMVQQPLKS